MSSLTISAATCAGRRPILAARHRQRADWDVRRLPRLYLGRFQHPKFFGLLADRLLPKEKDLRPTRITSSTWPPRPRRANDRRPVGRRRNLTQDRLTARGSSSRSLSAGTGFRPRAQRHARRRLRGTQIYRIDHYLGKETVQNILAFRFANAMFEPIWNRRYIDHVQITVAEQVGIEHRGGYYDQAGALRDMIQNHLLQVLCLVAMEPPVSFQDDEIRNKKVDVCTPSGRSRGTWSTSSPCAVSTAPVGWKGNRCRLPPGAWCGARFRTETFVALKLYMDNWRWQDVPFYLRTGKRLPARSRKPPSIPACAAPIVSPLGDRGLAAQPAGDPDPAVRGYPPALSGQAARSGRPPQPGRHALLLPGSVQGRPPEAYETLLLDVMRGDATLFMRADQVEAAWAVITPILEGWEAASPEVFPELRGRLVGAGSRPGAHRPRRPQLADAHLL